MTDYVIPLPPVPSLSVAGQTTRFPVRRIFCVGRNYAEHVRELGNDVRDPPFFFMKPADALVEDGQPLPYPPGTQDLHHEAELVVAIGLAGAEIPEESALAYVWGYAAGNDLTLRDVQNKAKEMRRPWDMSKGFDHSAVCGAIHPVTQTGHPGPEAAIRLTVNGALRQEGRIGDMIWPVAGIIAHLSRLVELHPGDLIYTGTPAGVGTLGHGDICTVEVEGLSPVTTQVV